MNKQPNPQLNQQTPSNAEVPLQPMKSPVGFGTVFIIVVVFFSIAGFVLFKTNIIKDEVLSLAEKFDLYTPPKTTVTYYQWTDDNGNAIVSTEKPTDGKEYFSFQGDSTLVSNNNQVDQSLIAKSEAYRAKLLAGEDSDSEESSGDGTTASGYSKTLQKAKHCIEMAQKVAEVNREMKQDKKSNAIREKQRKDCIDNFQVK